MRNVHPNLRKIKQSFSERSSRWTRYEEVIKFKEEKKITFKFRLSLVKQTNT